MIFFIMGNSGQPNPQSVASESLRSAQSNVRLTELRKDAAISRLLETQRNYDESTFSGASKIAEARWESIEAEAAHTHALRKLEWEKRNGWREQIPVKPGAMPTPWRTDLKGWLDIFKNRIR